MRTWLLALILAIFLGSAGAWEGPSEANANDSPETAASAEK